jgi:hypothetical protein
MHFRLIDLEIIDTARCTNCNSNNGKYYFRCCFINASSPRVGTGADHNLASLRVWTTNTYLNFFNKTRHVSAPSKDFIASLHWLLDSGKSLDTRPLAHSRKCFELSPSSPSSELLPPPLPYRQRSMSLGSEAFTQPSTRRSLVSMTRSPPCY